MKTVKINRLLLLDKIKENRERHIIEFKEAWNGYVDMAITKMKENLKKAQKERKVEHGLSLVIPQSFEENYDRIISMLEWSNEDTVELDHNEFEQYVRDNWNWKQNFGLTNSLYKAS